MMRSGVQGPLGPSGNSPTPPLDYRPPPDVGLQIVHQDPSLLVLNKPAGLLSVPGKGEHLHDCMEHRARKDFPSATVVHRLDRATSGLFLMALDPAAHRHVGLQFERRRVKKKYIAVVYGDVSGEFGTIELPLRTDWYNRPKQMVDQCLGRPALTRWQVVSRCGDRTRVELTPETGRTHQLRVHMKAIGHPIVGDEFYAEYSPLQESGRLMLHAASLEILHPENGNPISFETRCPF